jgi:hypothetical protein
MRPPRRDEPSTISDFRGVPSARIGTVTLRLSVHRPLEQQPVITFTKQYEVSPITEPFIFGRDILQVLFPRDTALMYGKPPSVITDAPTDIDPPIDITVASIHHTSSVSSLSSARLPLLNPHPPAAASTVTPQQ